MKLNVNKVMTVNDYDRLMFPFIENVKSKHLIPLNFEGFYEGYITVVDRLNTIMPEVHQRGLIFKITAPLGDRKPNDRLMSPWITIQRGSKHWFITQIEVNRPAVTAVHPVNLAITEDNEARLWSIIEKVTNPSWFN